MCRSLSSTTSLTCTQRSWNKSKGLIRRHAGGKTTTTQVRHFFSRFHKRLTLDYSRHGQPEERDPHRLRDKNGAPVLCFKCGMSALPVGLASTIPTAKRPRRSTSKAVTPEGYKDMVSCDFCSLHWHLDCLDPPLSAMPPLSKKWMCPNHAERLVVSTLSSSSLVPTV